VASSDSDYRDEMSEAEPPAREDGATEDGSSRGGSADSRWTSPLVLATLILGVLGIIGGVAAAIITTNAGGGHSGVTVRNANNPLSPCNGEVISGSHNSINCAPKVISTGSPVSNDPRAQIVTLTGAWSNDGFVDAIVERDTKIVALYLKTGLSATTLHRNASAILWAFQGRPQNGDPVALVKTFQAAGFKVDERLEDNYLMAALTDNLFPLPFHTNLTPKGYEGGVEPSTFVGSLLFWIVQRVSGTLATEQDLRVIKYLISQGADCDVPLSYLKYDRTTLDDDSPYKELLALMENCAK
jgi:hypothetical protein